MYAHIGRIYYRFSIYHSPISYDIERNTKERKLNICSDYEHRKDARTSTLRASYGAYLLGSLEKRFRKISIGNWIMFSLLWLCSNWSLSSWQRRHMSQGIAWHRQLDNFLSSFCRLKTEKTDPLCKWIPLAVDGFSVKRWTIKLFYFSIA